jgi:hypothetical protein
MNKVNVKAVVNNGEFTLTVKISELSQAATDQKRDVKGVFLQCCGKAFDQIVDAAASYENPIPFTDAEVLPNE